MFSIRHGSAVINWRFCLTQPAFRPKACRRLLVNSIAVKRPSSCRRTILRTTFGCASLHLGWSSILRDIRHSLCSDGSRFAGAAESKNAALRPALTVHEQHESFSDVEEFQMKKILTQYGVFALAVALMVPLAQ